MKLIIDIPEDDYIAVRYEALYYIGHDRLARSVTTAFQTATPYEERPQGAWEDYSVDFYKCPECGYLLNKDCPHCGNKVILPKGGTE